MQLVMMAFSAPLPFLKRGNMFKICTQGSFLNLEFRLKLLNLPAGGNELSLKPFLNDIFEEEVEEE